jgi:hypothetical protein
MSLAGYIAHNKKTIPTVELQPFNMLRLSIYLNLAFFFYAMDRQIEDDDINTASTMFGGMIE